MPEKNRQGALVARTRLPWCFTGNRIAKRQAEQRRSALVARTLLLVLRTLTASDRGTKEGWN